MANHKSAEKRARQTKVRTARNRANKANVKTQTKKLESAVAAKDKKAAAAALPLADSALQRLARKGTIPKNTAARRQSRLAKKVAKLGK